MNTAEKAELKKLNDEVVSRAKDLNKGLIYHYKKQHQDKGIDTKSFVGGIGSIICSYNSDLRSNINSILVAYQHNYMEFVGYQVNNIKLQRLVNDLEIFLSAKDLDREFKEWRKAKEVYYLK